MNLRINGVTKLYAVIGDPIMHTVSPEIHNSVFDFYKSNNIYIPLNVKSVDLEKSMDLFRKNLSGFNVTIPHKQTIIKFVDDLDGDAKAYGAVNTIKVVDDKFIGYNTDGYGFSKSLDINNLEVQNQNILLLGTGGASRVVAHELLKKGAELTISSRNISKAEKLKNELELAFDKTNIKTVQISGIKGRYYGIVNGTPVGMSPQVDLSPVNEDLLKDTNFVFDLIYNPYKTALLKMAEKKGCKVINGFTMLFYQAIKAQEIWFDQELPDEVTKTIYQELSEYVFEKLKKQ